MGKASRPPGLPRAPSRGHRAPRLEPAQYRAARRRVRLRRLRAASVHVGDEIRQRHRLAELRHLHSGRIRNVVRQQVERRGSRIPLRQVRWPPRPRVQRRTQAPRRPLVQQRRGAALHPARIGRRGNRFALAGDPHQSLSHFVGEGHLRCDVAQHAPARHNVLPRPLTRAGVRGAERVAIGYTRARNFPFLARFTHDNKVRRLGRPWAPRGVPIAFDVVGQTEGAKEVEVRARVAGILLKQLYHEGDTVRAGAPLFEIDPATYEVALKEANAALAQERARLAQATRDEARFRDLVADKAVSQKDYDDALSQKQLSDATVQQAAAKVEEAKLNLSYTAVNAPVGGISGRAQRSVGSLITTDANGSLLTTINQVNPIWVRFSLAESDLAKLPGGKLARTGAVVEIALADGTRYPDKGKLNFAATEIDARLGTQQLRAEFDNKREDLVPGQFVRVHLIAGRRDNVFLVPQAAVMQTENGYFVFVVGSDGKAMARTVQTGAWIGSDWTILAGLKRCLLYTSPSP